MTKFLFVRHGESQANLDRIFVGQTDSPLTELGQKQAAMTAAYLAAHYKVDYVYASDLSRAYITGAVIAKACNAPIQADRGLREVYVGLWEGVPFKEVPVRFKDTHQLWITNVGFCRFEAGESMMEAQARMVKTLRQIGNAHPDAVIVIATHASALRAFQTYCEGKTQAEMQQVPLVSNASVTEIEYDGADFHLIAASYDKHLGDYVTVLPPIM